MISDDELLGAQIREILHREGEDIPASHMLPLDLAAGQLANLSPDLVVVVLSADSERCLTALEVLETFSKSEGRARARVLAVGPATDPKLVLRALRGGIDDYVDEAELEAELKAALL